MLAIVWVLVSRVGLNLARQWVRFDLQVLVFLEACLSPIKFSWYIDVLSLFTRDANLLAKWPGGYTGEINLRRDAFHPQETLDAEDSAKHLQYFPIPYLLRANRSSNSLVENTSIPKETSFPDFSIFSAVFDRAYLHTDDLRTQV